MTLSELITRVKDEKPNGFSDGRLISFVNEIEAEVAEQMHLKAPIYGSLEQSGGVELLAHDPYSRLYVSYLEAMIDRANEEYEMYSNNSMQHNQDFKDFIDWGVRTQFGAMEMKVKRFRNVL